MRECPHYSIATITPTPNVCNLRSTTFITLSEHCPKVFFYLIRCTFHHHLRARVTLSPTTIRPMIRLFPQVCSFTQTQVYLKDQTKAAIALSEAPAHHHHLPDLEDQNWLCWTYHRCHWSLSMLTHLPLVRPPCTGPAENPRCSLKFSKCTALYEPQSRTSW